MKEQVKQSGFKPGEYDPVRMEKAVLAQRFELPRNLTREQKKAHIAAAAHS